MVREQEPARNPLAPAQARAQPAGKPTLSESRPSIPATSPALKKSPLDIDMASPQPVFGRTTALGGSTPISGRYQAHEINKSQSQGQSQSQSQLQNSREDSHSHLFIPKSRRPDFHQPPGTKNPLTSLNRNPNKAKKTSDDSDDGDDSVYVVPRPLNYPSLSQPQKSIQTSTVPQYNNRPFQPPTFSSAGTANPFFQPKKDFVDLTATSSPPLQLGEETFNDRHVFGNDRFGTSDPYTYVDSNKAHEDIKALLEGAMDDDEESRPKSRRQKKTTEVKVDALAGQLSDLNVELKQGDREEEEEEEEAVDDGVRPGLKVQLLPHQIEGVEWMRSREVDKKKVKGILPKGGILADDMGLGKTIQSIALILTNPKPTAEEIEKQKLKNLDAKCDRCTLVIAPLALIKQWEAEIKDRVEESHALQVRVHHGPARAKSYKELRKYDVVITTYQTLSSEHDNNSGGGGVSSESSLKSALFGVNWYRVILDEAHSIKNRNAKSTKAACGLTAQYRWCLTGTPMQNNLDELQSLIHFLRIRPYDTLDTWREQITKPMNNGRGGLAIRRLRAFLSAFMKRRTKDVLKLDGGLGKKPRPSDSASGPVDTSLTTTRAAGGKGTSDAKATPGGGSSGNTAGFRIVQRLVHNVAAEFNEQERAFYERLEARTDRSLEMMMAGHQLNYANALVLLMRLRQACNHPKLLGADLAKEQEALSGSSRSPSKKTAGKNGGGGDGMDEIANMLGGLSVEMKRCDICQIELDKTAVQEGLLRCEECEEDFRAQTTPSKKDKSRRSGDRKSKSAVVVKKQSKRKEERQQASRKPARRVVLDSDDEDDETSSSSSEEDEDEDEGDDDSHDGDSSECDSSSSSPSPDLISSTKIRQLLSILSHDSHTHKYIVFSFFTSMLNLIEPFLRSASPPIKFVRYDGAMRNDLREASLSSLRSDPSVRVLLCSLRAGSLGLNLTAASRVVVLEPFWNPFVEEQAIDRVHRLNQTQDVVVHKLTIKNTVEARILELQEKKRELARHAIEGGKGGIGGVNGAGLSKEELLSLFSRDGDGASGGKYVRDATLDMIGMKDGRKGLMFREDSEPTTSPVQSQSHTQRQSQGRGMDVSDNRGHSQRESSGSTDSYAGPVPGRRERERERGKDGEKEKRKEDPIYGRRW